MLISISDKNTIKQIKKIIQKHNFDGLEIIDNVFYFDIITNKNMEDAYENVIEHLIIPENKKKEIEKYVEMHLKEYIELINIDIISFKNELILDKQEIEGILFGNEQLVTLIYVYDDNEEKIIKELIKEYIETEGIELYDNIMSFSYFTNKIGEKIYNKDLIEIVQQSDINKYQLKRYLLGELKNYITSMTIDTYWCCVDVVKEFDIDTDITFANMYAR